jgi:hypothetical protein
MKYAGLTREYNAARFVEYARSAEGEKLKKRM